MRRAAPDLLCPRFDWGSCRGGEPAALLTEALDTAGAIAANAPLSVRQAKKSIHYGLQMDLRTGYRFEIEAYNRLVDTAERTAGGRSGSPSRPRAATRPS